MHMEGIYTQTVIHMKRTNPDGIYIRKRSAHEGSYIQSEIYTERYTRINIHTEGAKWREYIYGGE